MNPAKLLEDVLSTLQKYAPILVVHGVLLLWLSARVLDPGALPEGNTIWALITARINSALTAVGLSLSLWYVITALLIAYLAAFQWLRSLVTQVPFLRIRYTLHYKPELLRFAGETLQLRPDSSEVSQSLDNLVDRYNKEVRDTNRRHPYQWQFDREHTWIAYYGTLLVAWAGALAWAIEGGTMARSPSHVWSLVVLLGFTCLMVRWRMVRLFAEGRNQLGYWSLREFERQTTGTHEDPLRWKRGELIEKQAKFLAAAKRHPAMILQSLLYRLPRRLTRRLQDRLRPPYWRIDDDWDILTSHAMKYQDEKNVPPEALRVDSLLKRFTGLLECPGAGLCLLAPQRLGLAPAVPGGGSTYSFAERRHGGNALAITLTCDNDLTNYELYVHRYGDERAILAEVGRHPIELAAQRDFIGNQKNWYALIGAEFGEQNWLSDTDRRDKVMDDITLSFRLSMTPGSTYVMRSKSLRGTEAVVAFQCFQIEDSAKMLIAWRILDVFSPKQESAPDVVQWWQLKAWRDLWQTSTNHKRRRV